MYPVVSGEPQVAGFTQVINTLMLELAVVGAGDGALGITAGIMTFNNDE